MKVSPINSEMVLVDIGANDGTSIRMMRQHDKNSRIIAFDPITRPSFKLENIDFNVVALSNKSGDVAIFTPEVRGYELTQYSSFYKEKLKKQASYDLGIDQKEISIIERNVDENTLDAYGLRPYFVKIDVEGAELEVLEGAVETLSKYQPIVLVEIQNSDTYDAIQAFMEVLGYSNVDPESSKSEKSQVGYMPNRNNYLWISDKRSSSWTYKS